MCLDPIPDIFTFHYVSINTIQAVFSVVAAVFFTFHYVSINTQPTRQSRRASYTLHSTMFLLIPENSNGNIYGADFTFHYVSINTKNTRKENSHERSLHSTMFLLIHFGETGKAAEETALHSTMFLLILRLST